MMLYTMSRAYTSFPIQDRQIQLTVNLFSCRWFQIHGVMPQTNSNAKRFKPITIYL